MFFHWYKGHLLGLIAATTAGSNGYVLVLQFQGSGERNLFSDAPGRMGGMETMGLGLDRGPLDWLMSAGEKMGDKASNWAGPTHWQFRALKQVCFLALRNKKGLLDYYFVNSSVLFSLMCRLYPHLPGSRHLYRCWLSAQVHCLALQPSEPGWVVLALRAGLLSPPHDAPPKGKPYDGNG